MSILIPSKRSRFRTPPANAGIARGDPITLGLLYGWTMHEPGLRSYDIFQRGRDIVWVDSPKGRLFERPAMIGDGTGVFGSVAMDLSSTSVLSLSFWYYQPTDTETDGLVFEFTADLNTNNGAFFFNPLEPSNSTNGWYFAVRGDTGNNGNMIPRGTAGNWYHIAITWDFALSGSELAQAFTNGVPQTVTAYTGIQAANSGSSTFANSTLYFGARSTGAAPANANTQLANLLVYNRYLTVAEALRLYLEPHCFLRQITVKRTAQAAGGGPTSTNQYLQLLGVG